MRNQKSNTRRTLALSIMAICLCCVMLIGTTFAWFTDTATSGLNHIQSGSLDMDVEYTLDGETWHPLDDATDLFGGEDAKFEPGYTRVVAFRVTNKGNLAFKYRLAANVAEETPGTNVFGNEFKLSDYLETSYAHNQVNMIGDILVSLAFDRNSQKAIGWHKGAFDAVYSVDDSTALLPGDGHYVIMKVTMPETVGNEANAKDANSMPAIHFGVSVVATQAAIERDSYDHKYDLNAEYPTIVSTSAELEAALSEDKEHINVTLVGDASFDIKPYAAKPMGGASTKTISINGGGHKLTFNNTDSDWNNVTTANGALLSISNAVIDNGGYNADGGTWNGHDITFNCDVALSDVTFANAVAIDAGRTAILRNVSISDANTTGDAYMLWICAGANVTAENLTINGVSENGNANRAIKIADQYIDAPARTTLTIKGATITSDKKAAIYVSTVGGADINLESVDISGVKADSTNAVWVDDGYNNPDAITVKGGTAIVKG